MAKVTVIAPTTSASGSAGPPVVAGGTFDAGAYKWIAVSADNLAGAEEVDIYYYPGGTGWKPAINSSGTTQKLTASITTLILDAQYNYGFLKDATVSACGVYVTPGPAL